MKHKFVILIQMFLLTTLYACGSDNSSESKTVTEAVTVTEGQGSFTLTSSVMLDGGSLPVTYSCDGDGISPALNWSNPPAGTTSYALVMHHEVTPDDTHWYWVMYDIPSNINSISDSEIAGVMGSNSINIKNEYSPPCSQGTGEKWYTFSLYALSQTPDLSDSNIVDRDTLLDAINGITLDTATLEVSYDRNTTQSTSEYSIEQSISPHAQETTIAYDGLAFLTGNQCSDSFLPPGKVADFFGFQHLRDNTANGMGHNTDFVTNSANNVLYILNESQTEEILALAATQTTLINQFAYERLPLMKAFRMGLDDSITLDKDAIVEYAKQLQLDDAIISIQRAKLFGSIIRSLTTDQKSYLDDMVTGGFEMWPSLEEQIDRTTMSHDEHVLVMTFASELFGWYAGSVEADTYFAPERQANYFGSFYMKDAPAMGNENYTIDETITGNKGAEFLTYLTESQKTLVTEIVDIQYDNLLNIVDVRRKISTELRKFLTHDSIDEDMVMTLAETYGALDGANSYLYATRFAEVNVDLSESQKSDLMVLRDLDDYPCADTNIYVYSEKMELSAIQRILDISGITEFLLGE